MARPVRGVCTTPGVRHSALGQVARSTFVPSSTERQHEKPAWQVALYSPAARGKELLEDRPRSGRPRKITPDDEAEIVRTRVWTMCSRTRTACPGLSDESHPQAGAAAWRTRSVLRRVHDDHAPRLGREVTLHQIRRRPGILVALRRPPLPSSRHTHQTPTPELPSHGQGSGRPSDHHLADLAGSWTTAPPHRVLQAVH